MRRAAALGVAALALAAVSGRAAAQAASGDSAGRAARARTWFNAGVAAWRANDLPAARRAWERAHRADPALEPATLNLAAALALTGEARGAAALYDTLLRAPEPSEAAFAAAARFWAAAGREDLAAGVAEKGLERFARSGRLMLVLGDAEATRERWTDAATAYRRAAPLLPRREEAELPLLGTLVAAKDTASALALARQLADRPASRDARRVVAALADSLGAAGLADTTWRALLAADSLDLDAMIADARLAERAGDTARAVGLLTRAAAADSSGAEAPLALLRLTRPGPDSTRVLLRRAVWHGMAAQERVEMALLGGSRAALASGAGPVTEPVARLARDRLRRGREALVAALDRALLGEPWGPTDLEQLRLAFPGSRLLDAYTARLAERQGDPAAALAAVDGLLRTAPADADLQRSRGRLLERLGRPSDAAQAYARALDLEPENDSTFRALQRLSESQGTLAVLLEQIQRLRIRLRDSRVLADHETEVRQRLGAQPPPSARDASPSGGRR